MPRFLRKAAALTPSELFAQRYRRSVTPACTISARLRKLEYICGMSRAIGKLKRAFAAAFVFAATAARGQTAPAQDDDHRAVVEIGLAGERGVTGSSSSGGGTVAVEFTPIENWLELESGVTALRGAGQTEFALDLLFKKPWRLSATSEFMAGVGPELAYHPGAGARTSVATEVVADWMFWPTKNVGWYFEPSYSFTAIAGGERNVGIAAGLIIGIR